MPAPERAHGKGGRSTDGQAEHQPTAPDLARASHWRQQQHPHHQPAAHHQHRRTVHHSHGRRGRPRNWSPTDCLPPESAAGSCRAAPPKTPPPQPWRRDLRQCRTNPDKGSRSRPPRAPAKRTQQHAHHPRSEERWPHRRRPCPLRGHPSHGLGRRRGRGRPAMEGWGGRCRSARAAPGRPTRGRRVRGWF